MVVATIRPSRSSAGVPLSQDAAIGDALNAQLLGVAAGNTGNQAAAINAADAAAALAGVPLYFPAGTYRCTAAITQTTDWLLDPLTKIRCATDLTSNAIFLTMATTKRIVNGVIEGPNPSFTIGVATNATSGVRVPAKAKMRHTTVTGFKRGIVAFGDHMLFEDVRSISNYINLYFPSGMPSDGDGRFYNCDFAGGAFASIGVASGGKCAGHLFDNSHFGFIPYGVYKEGGSNEAILIGCDLISSPIESVGNGAIVDGSGTGSNFLTGNRLGEATWDATYKIAANAADYLYDVPVWLRNTLDVGDLDGLPQFAAGAIALIRCTNYAQRNTIYGGEQLMDFLANTGGKPVWANGGDIQRTNVIRDRSMDDWLASSWFCGAVTRGDVVQLTGNNVVRADDTKPIIGVALDTRSGGQWATVLERGRTDLVKVNASVSADAFLMADSASAGRVKPATLGTNFRILGVAVTAQASAGAALTALVRPMP